jgi:exosortase N
MYNYVDWSSASLGVGFMALFLTPRSDDELKRPSRYGWATLLFFTLYLLVPVKTGLYLTVASGLLLAIETFYRKMPPTVPLVILLISPVCQYAIQVFSFPIRLHLSSMAGSIMHCAGLPVISDGNLLVYRGHEFSVDPACMGLHMLQISLLTGILLIHHYQGVYRRHMRLYMIGLLLAHLVVLNILANLTRIIILVLFSIAPENPMHGLMGICCWLVYGIIPVIPAVRWAARHGTPGVQHVTGPRALSSPRAGCISWNLVAAGLALIAVLLSLSAVKDPLQDQGTLPVVSGYSVKRLPGRIWQLGNSRSLVYIKSIPDFYYTDHTPMICWEGSGYKFCNLREEKVGVVSLYKGVLRNKDRLLYTAWWYDNGYHRSNGSIEWRWDVIKGSPKYSLVNITAATQPELDDEVRRVLNTSPFYSLLTGNFANAYPVKK